MVLGLNPFTNLQAKVDSAQYDGTATVRGVPTDVVTLRIASRTEETQSRFYIGKEDRLLYRMVTDTAPILSPIVSGKIGDPFDELLDDNPPPSSTPPANPNDPNAPSGSVALVKTRIAYDNVFVAHPTFGPQAFRYNIPADALFYQPLDLNGNGPKISSKEYLRELIKSVKNKQRALPPQIVR